METGLLPTETGAAAPQPDTMIATKVSKRVRNRIDSILTKTPRVAKLKPMPVYPEEIALLIRSPRFSRAVPDTNAEGTDARLDCGCFVRVELRISEEGLIEDIGFRSNGCGFMVAAAESLARSINGRPLTGLSGIPDISLELPDDRRGCERAVSEAFRKAFASYRQKLVAEFRGEKPLICTCFGVPEETVEAYVAANHPESVDEVSKRLRAGNGCGSCRMLIQEIIDAND